MNLIVKIPLRYARPSLRQSFRPIDEQERIWSWLKKFYPDAIPYFGRVKIVSEEAIWETNKQGFFQGLDNFKVVEKLSYAEQFHRFRARYLKKIDELLPKGSSQRNEWYVLLESLVTPNTVLLYSNGIDFIILWGFDFSCEAELEIEPSLYANIYSDFDTTLLTKVVSHSVIVSSSEKHNEIQSPLSIKLGESTTIDSQRWLRSNKASPYNRGRWVSALFSWLFEISWKYLVPILLLILILWVIFCFNCCKGLRYHFTSIHYNMKIEQADILIKELISRPRPPIDTTQIEIRDSLYDQVISNVINLAPQKRNVNLRELVADILTFFPNPEYEIVYIDSTTTRIQIRFTKDKKRSIQGELKSKLRKYNLLVWDEAIFSGIRTFSDPALHNSSLAWHLQAINCFQAWDITTGDTSVCIAVIDDGFDLAHEDISKQLCKPYNVHTRDRNIWASQSVMHGTHTSGIATARSDNGTGLCGVAPDVSLMPIQICNQSGQFTSSDIIDGILYAINNNADVINLSLGRKFDPSIQFLTEDQQKSFIKTQMNDEARFWDALFQYAETENTIIVIAAGNNNILTGMDPFQRSRYSICVSAIDQAMHKAMFSNFGSGTMISAPGVGVYSMVPNNQYVSMDGTSMASPIVAGAIGLLKSRYHGISNEQIRRHLKATTFPQRDERVPAAINVYKLLQTPLDFKSPHGLF